VGVFRKRSKRFWATLIVVVTVVVFYLPSLVAFRYTASPQRTSFLTHPWRSWDFVTTLLTVPGDARLKTSGAALRKADTYWYGSGVDPQSVRVLFLPAGRPYTFTHEAAGQTFTTTIRPPYKLVWQVRGELDGDGGHASDTIVGLLDYRTGRVLYDIRNDVPALSTNGAGLSPEPVSSPSVSPSRTP
jgi:hypothetical protein